MLFDDPFDVTRVLAADIKASEIQECLIDSIIDLIKNNTEVRSEFNPKVCLMIETLRKSGRNDVKEEIIRSLYDLKNEPIMESSALGELRKMWEDMVLISRILCLSARNNIELMWDRYADKYRGVVLEFSCLKELDSPWLIFEPVQYRPSFLDKVGWGRVLTLNQDAATKYIFHESCYTKTSDWSYQEEWRIVSFKRTGENGEYSYYKFNPKELSAIYLGPEIVAEDRECILSLLNNELSHVKVYSGSITVGCRIEFRELPSVRVERSVG